MVRDGMAHRATDGGESSGTNGLAVAMLLVLLTIGLIVGLLIFL